MALAPEQLFSVDDLIKTGVKFIIATTNAAPSMEQSKVEFVGTLEGAKAFAKESHSKTKRSTSVLFGTYCHFMMHDNGKISIDRE